MRRSTVPRVTSLRRRMVLATAVLTTFGMAALLVLVVLVLGHVVNEDIDGLLRARAAAVLSTVERLGGTVDVQPAPDAGLDNLAWVYDAAGTLVAGPAASPAIAPHLAALQTIRAPTARDGNGWRFRAVPIVLDGGPEQLGVVIVGVSLEPYETTEQRTLLVGIGLAVLVIVGVSAMAAWLVRRALKPVAIMARRAAEWSEDDLSRRFDLGEPRDELTQLGQVFDALLSRVSRTILAEQRLTAELAHELRTPLTVIRAEAELATLDGAVSTVQRERFGRIIASVDQMTDAITTLLSVARGAVSQDDRAQVDEVFAAATANIGQAGRHLAVTPAPGLELAVPHSVAVRALAPLLDNALRFGRSSVALSAQARGESVEISVVDDGPGFGDLAPGELFAPGFHRSDSPGAGLGLSLSRRLARACGGDVVAVLGGAATGAATGAERTIFILRLPRAPGRQADAPADEPAPV